MKRTTKPSDRVSELMKRKVQVEDFMKEGDPDLHTKLVLELACAIHYSRSTDCVVSWEAQEEAMKYFNKNGFEATLEYMFEIKDKKGTIE